MTRFFFLLCEKTMTLIKTNLFVFLIYIMVLIVTAFSYLYFYSTVVKNRTDFVSKYESMRTISVTLQNDKTIDSKIVDEIINNGVAKPDQVTFYFTSSEEKTPKQLWAYLYPEKESSSVSGESITETDVNNKSAIIIPANCDKYSDPDPTHHQLHEIGDKIDIGGISFYAKGVRHGGWLDEIPYTTGIESFKLTNFDVLMPAGLTDNDKKNVGAYFTSKLEATDVQLPKPIAVKVFGNLLFPLVASTFIGIIAILNSIFLFKYMIESNRHNYTILRICGCSLSKCLMLLLTQMALFFTVAYILSIAVFLILKAIVGSAMSLHSIDLLGYLIIYLTFILIIIVIMLPTGINFIKNTVITDEKKHN